MQEFLKIASSIKKEIETLSREVEKLSKTHAQYLAEEWIDKEKVLQILRISSRKLQSLRDNGSLPFSQVDGKIYYKTSDVERLLNSRYNNQ
ncbi:MAG: helix-turn-helix domain-containing protein [Mangrovibacterium sp.]